MITEGQVLDIAKDAIYYIIICSHFDSGADTYICTKDCGSIYWIDGMWFVDSESAVGICDDLMVELQYLSWIGLTYGAVFIFIGKF